MRVVSPKTYAQRWRDMLDPAIGMKAGDYLMIQFGINDGDYTKGAVGAFFCNDHTHFEAAGAQQIARVVTKALRDQRIPLANHLK